VKTGTFLLGLALAPLAALLAACPGSGSAGPAPPPPSVSTAEGGADPQTGEVRYLAMGDSITQGIGTPAFETEAFPARLAERWRAKGCGVDLKNVAVGGYTASDIIANEVPEVEPYKPTFITVQVGANDIVNNVPLETYRTNVRAVLDAAKKSGARVVVLPQNEWFRSPEGINYGGTAEARNAYDAVLIEEAKAKGAELVDLRALYRQHADKKLWAEDGLHPTAACYDEMAAELARVIPSPCGK
jgi:acyl-CoA thioesterase I